MEVSNEACVNHFIENTEKVVSLNKDGIIIYGTEKHGKDNKIDMTTPIVITKEAWEGIEPLLITYNDNTSQNLCEGGGFTNDSLRQAVYEWTTNKEVAEKKHGNINSWDTSCVTDMSELFQDNIDFNDNIGNWNTSKVTTMKGMFRGAEEDPSYTYFNK